MPQFRYLAILDHDPRPKLFSFTAPAPVRATALQVLENRPESDFLFRHALKDCPGYAPMVHLLDTWNEDGTWGVDRLFMRKHGEKAAKDRSLVAAVRNLHLLTLYRWNPRSEDGYLEECVEQIKARQTAAGTISLISPDARWVTSEHPSVIHSDHWGSTAVSILQRMGLRSRTFDEHCQTLCTTQRADGGWLPEYEARLAGAGPGAASHPLHTVAALGALQSHPQQTGSRVVMAGLDFLLEHCCKKTGPYRRASAGRWKLMSEPDFGYSILSTLELAISLGLTAKDTRLAPLVDWVADQQRKDGTWHATAQRTSHKHENHFLTLRAAAAIKRLIDDNTPPE